MCLISPTQSLQPSLGSVPSDDAAVIRTWKNYTLIPSLVLAMIKVAFNFLGDSLRGHPKPTPARHSITNEMAAFNGNYRNNY